MFRHMHSYFMYFYSSLSFWLYIILSSLFLMFSHVKFGFPYLSSCYYRALESHYILVFFGSLRHIYLNHFSLCWTNFSSTGANHSLSQIPSYMITNPTKYTYFHNTYMMHISYFRRLSFFVIQHVGPIIVLYNLPYGSHGTILSYKVPNT
jgi:hypothetical protein